MHLSNRYPYPDPGEVLIYVLKNVTKNSIKSTRLQKFFTYLLYSQFSDQQSCGKSMYLMKTRPYLEKSRYRNENKTEYISFSFG